MGFPGGTSSKEPACQCRRLFERLRFDPWVGKIPQRRAQQPTQVFLPGESHGQRSLAGCGPQGCTESGMTACMHAGYIMSPRISLSFANPLLLLLSHFSRVQLCVTPQTAATRLPHPQDSPGKNTGVGCRFLLQCRKVKSESEVAQSCPTLCANPLPSYKESEGKLCPSHHASRRLLPPLCLPCLILFILAAIYICHFNRMSQSGSPSNMRTVSQKSKMIVKSQALLIKITSKLTQSLLLCLEQI